MSHANNDKGGMFGVTIFFFLSGFLITTLLRRENDLYGAISLRGFYLRRIIRICPSLYLTLGLILLLSITNILNNSLVPGFFAATSMFVANYWLIFFQPLVHNGNPGLGPFWSLAVEEHFYLFFPLLFALN